MILLRLVERQSPASVGLYHGRIPAGPGARPSLSPALPLPDPSRNALPFLPPDCTWRCLIRASVMRGGMVGQDAPSRPIRVTVPFAGGCTVGDELARIGTLLR